MQSTSTSIEIATPQFVDRRSVTDSSANVDRRQFASSHEELSPDARELATAMDAYKLHNHRRYISVEEMLQVIRQLGYAKITSNSTGH